MSLGVQKSIGADGRSEVYPIDPLKIIITRDPLNPTYDERVDEEIGLPMDEAMVLDIMDRGVTQAIDGRRNGKWPNGDFMVEVVDGRQRLLHLIEANRRRALVGQPALQIEVNILIGMSDEQIYERMARSNEYRRPDTAIIKARKMKRAVDLLKYTPAMLAVTFNMSEARVERHLLLLDLHIDLQKAAGHGVPMRTLLELGAFPRDRQPAELQKLRASGQLRGAAAAEAIAEAAGVPAPPPKAASKRPGVKWLRAVEGGAKETLLAAQAGPEELAYAEGLRDALTALSGDPEARKKLDRWAASDPEACARVKKANAKAARAKAAKSSTSKGKKAKGGRGA